jgi:hypothetical protein
VLAVAEPALALHCAGGTLVGGGGDDDITGSVCDDVIVGNDGDNTLTGRLGHDLFAVSTGFCPALEWQSGWVQVDTPPLAGCFQAPVPFFPAFGVSDITDFTQGFDRIGLDKATLQAVQSEVGTGLSDASDLAVVDADADVEADTAAIVYSRESELLFYNENRAAPGLGQGGPFAGLTDVETLTPADFQVLDWTASAPAPTTTLPAAPPCTSPRCFMEGALRSQACAGDTVPPSVATKLDRALDLIDMAAATGKVKPLKGAARLLKKATKAAGKASHGRRPRLSTACADAIRTAADGVRSGLRRSAPRAG